MADYRVTDTQLSSIANAIRTKGGTSALLAFPSGFVSAVENIPTSGGVLISKTISQNGSYSAADDNADGYSDVIVNVSGGSSPVLISKTISQNGTYNPSDDDADAYSQVVVDVSGGGGGGESYDFILTGESGQIENSRISVIRGYAFYQHSGLTFVSFPNCLSIYINAFSSCSNLSNAVIPKCKSISDYAFYKCEKLQELYLPECTYIGTAAFGSCKNLKSITCQNVTSINLQAFMSCVNLESIKLDKYCTILSSAFRDCIKLQNVYLLASSVCSLGHSNAFQNTPIASSGLTGAFGSIFVPSSLVESYKSAAKWSAYSDRITSYVEE